MNDLPQTLLPGIARAALIAGVLAVPATLSADAGGDHPHGPQAAHRHSTWPAPPPEYAGRRSTRWADWAAIGRGARLYARHCASCHGERGDGKGPAAAALPHPPADLTHHFHRRPGEGDDYLFWRVSEGGAVAPFKAQGSAMPAFKQVLTEAERWDVLAYVHAYFHLGLAKWRVPQGSTP